MVAILLQFYPKDITNLSYQPNMMFSLFFVLPFHKSEADNETDWLSMDGRSDANFRKALNDPRWNEALITISSFNSALLFGERRCFSSAFFFARCMKCILLLYRCTKRRVRRGVGRWWRWWRSERRRRTGDVRVRHKRSSFLVHFKRTRIRMRM